MKRLTYSISALALIFSGSLYADNLDNLIKKVQEITPKYNSYQKENIKAKGLIVNNVVIKRVPKETDRIIVKVAPGTDVNMLINVVSKKENIHMSKVKEFHLKKPGISIKSSPKIVVIKVDDIDKIDDTIERIKAIPGVLNAEKDYIITAQMLPNDPDYPNLWGMQKINAEEAWNGSIGSSDVVVGVIDTGVDYLHPDLKNNIWVNEAELNGEPGKDDDGDGYVDDIYGIDTFNNDSDPMDDNGHGTHVSGTIAAEGNNGLGVVGVNWRAKIVACKFLSADGYGYTSGAIECVNYLNTLKDMGVNIVAVNNSWGGGGYSDDLYEAFSNANDEGIIHVCAAGNSSNDNDSNPSYPASYDLPNIIAVAATDQDDNLAWFSNYGATSVDIAAPGVDILSTFPSVIKCAPKKTIVGIGFEADSSVNGWTFLTIDRYYPFQDFTDLHWQRADVEGYDSNWSLDDSPNGNYPDNKIQSAVTRAFDLSDYNETADEECIGIQYKIKGDNEAYFDRLYLFLSGDGGNTWNYYMNTDKTYDEWSTEGRYVIDNSLLTDNFKIAFVRSNDCCYNYDGYKIDNLLIYQGTKYREARFATLSGTSMATPHVTGAIALAASIYPDENVTQRRERILNAVDVLDSLDGKVATSGRLNLVKVLNNGDKIIDGSYTLATTNQDWKTISFDHTIEKQPVIIAGPISYHGAQGCVVRLKDINENNFTIRVQEWNYLDGKHVNEDIPVLALTPGRYMMADGNVMEVGTFEISGTTDWKNVQFKEPFNDIPYLFLTVQTFNGSDAVVVRAKNVTTTGFSARLFEQQSLMGSGHAKEVVGYVAIYAPEGNGTIAGEEENVTYDLSQVKVNSSWTETPYDFQLLLQEEQSEDDETDHVKENIDVMYFNNELPFAQDVSTFGPDPITIRYKK